MAGRWFTGKPWQRLVANVPRWLVWLGRRLARLAFLAAIAVMIYSVVGSFVARRLVLGEMTPSERADFTAWNEEKIPVPEDVLDVKPFDAKTRSAAKALRENWEQYKDRAEEILRHQDASTTAVLDLGSLRSELAGVAPLIKAYEELAGRPDYEIMAFDSDRICDKDGSFFLYSPIVVITRPARLLGLKVQMLAGEGRTSESLAALTLLFRSAHTGPHASVISRVAEFTIFQAGIRTGSQIIRQGNRPEMLARLQELLKQVELPPPSAKIPLFAVDVLGEIRAYRRRGVPVTLPRKATWRQLYGLSWLARAQYLEQIALPLASGDPQWAKKIWREVSRSKSVAWSMGSPVRPASLSELRPWLIWEINLPLMRPFMQSIMPLMPSASEVFGRLRACWCAYDLLYLEVARQRYQFDRGKPPACLADLVPAYLKKIPIDQFARDEVPYRESGRRYYSIGPDQVDQRGALVYDPTNGTQSAGDLMSLP